MSSNQQILLGEGAGGAPAVFVEDVFSTYLYTGNGTTQTITNGIDLSTKGGLVWIKRRTGVNAHYLFDTARAANNYLMTNNSNAQNGYGVASDTLTAFGSSGFTLGADNTLGGVNPSGASVVSWTFREQPKFFDIVTYTGNDTARSISHSLGSVPGCIIVKCTSSSGFNWVVYHRSLGATQWLKLNLSDAVATNATYFPSDPTSTVFNIGAGGLVNSGSNTYVAYLFAHDAGGFGLAGTDNVISCGSYTGNGSSTGPTVTLGYEPQWIMVKRTDSTGSWLMLDIMRGIPNTPGVAAGSAYLFAESENAEDSAFAPFAALSATGFSLLTSNAQINASAGTYIYIAIRRGPMKVPTVGTSVYSPVARTGTGAAASVTAGFAVDFGISANRLMSTTTRIGPYSRLQGAGQVLNTNVTSAEVTRAGSVTGFTNTGITVGVDSGGGFVNASGDTIINWFFGRAPGFFDEVCYTGNAGPTGVPSSNQTIYHNLTVAPELIITKNRSLGSVNWTTWNASKILTLNTSDSAFSTTTNYISTVGANSFVVNNPSNAAFDCNASGSTYVAYLFATCAGVSKVGSYTGNGSSQTIACGFTAGSRFVLIKRTDSTGDWYVWDSARGIVAGNDPHLSLNSTAAEVTTDDSVDTDNSGFIVNQLSATNVNVTSATYIFLAIA